MTGGHGLIMTSTGDPFYSRALRSGARLLAAAAAITILAVPSTFAQYEQRNDRRYDDRDHYDRDYDDRRGGDFQRTATVAGYREGYENGMQDRRSRRGSDYRRGESYRRGDSGYDSTWNRQREYQDAFRRAYSKGYSDGYSGRQPNRSYAGNVGRGRGTSDPYYDNRDRGRYGDSYGYGTSPVYDNREGDIDRDEVAQRAAQNGYSAGFERGQYDMQQRARANPQGHGAYQHGMDGFDPEWGSAATYQQTYRQYFVQGYNDAFGRRQFDRRYNRRY